MAPPGATLDRLDGLVQGLSVPQLATVFYGRLVRSATAETMLTWANAGHQPPVLVGPDGRPAVLEGGRSVLVGALPVSPDEPREDATVTVPVGSTLLLYTDGLVERRGVDPDAGLDWLLETCAGHRTEEGPQALLDRVVGPLDRTALADDVAVLAVAVPA